MLTKALTYLRFPMNGVSLKLRRSLRFRRGQMVLFDQAKEELLVHVPPAERAALRRRQIALEMRYDLGGLASCSTRHDYRDNLAVLDALEKLADAAGLKLCASTSAQPKIRVFDVGAGSWNYVYALHQFCSRFDLPPETRPRQVDLTGIELDGYAIARDLRARLDRAEAYAAQLGNRGGVRYLVGDFLELELPQADVVTMFYPFLTTYPLLRWGLPLSCYRPRQLLQKGLERLAPGGSLIVFNQSDREKRKLVELVGELDAEIVASLQPATKFPDYQDPTRGRWASLVQRT